MPRVLDTKCFISLSTLARCCKSVAHIDNEENCEIFEDVSALVFLNVDYWKWSCAITDPGKATSESACWLAKPGHSCYLVAFNDFLNTYTNKNQSNIVNEIIVNILGHDNWNELHNFRDFIDCHWCQNYSYCPWLFSAK